jgi:hypothetical protein
MSEEKTFNPRSADSGEITELNEDQLSGVQGGQGISIPVKIKAITSVPKTTTGGSIAQGDTLDSSLLEDGLPS